MTQRCLVFDQLMDSPIVYLHQPYSARAPNRRGWAKTYQSSTTCDAQRSLDTHV